VALAAPPACPTASCACWRGRLGRRRCRRSVGGWVGPARRRDGGRGRAWQLAATHLLALGYLGGTALAMVSRVSATQSGQAQAVDGPLLALAGLLALTLAARLAVLVVGGAGAGGGPVDIDHRRLERLAAALAGPPACGTGRAVSR
jgi:hypothetical protein